MVDSVMFAVPNEWDRNAAGQNDVQIPQMIQGRVGPNAKMQEQKLELSDLSIRQITSPHFPVQVNRVPENSDVRAPVEQGDYMLLHPPAAISLDIRGVAELSGHFVITNSRSNGAYVYFRMENGRVLHKTPLITYEKSLPFIVAVPHGPGRLIIATNGNDNEDMDHLFWTKIRIRARK